MKNRNSSKFRGKKEVQKTSIRSWKPSKLVSVPSIVSRLMEEYESRRVEKKNAA